MKNAVNNNRILTMYLDIVDDLIEEAEEEILTTKELCDRMDSILKQMNSINKARRDMVDYLKGFENESKSK